MAFKMKAGPEGPMVKNYESALKTAGHGAKGSHVHTNKDGTSTFYNKDGVKMIKGADGVDRTPAEHVRDKEIIAKAVARRKK
tara:strand:- start:11 stop:256 length:246 start_codon:yes stop_codon:yes gene_type:complete